MSKLRIHELAKELGVENKVLIDKANSLGFNKKSHSNTLSDTEIKELRAAFGEDTQIREGIFNFDEPLESILETPKPKKTVIKRNIVEKRSANVVRRKKVDEEGFEEKSEAEVKVDLEAKESSDLEKSSQETSDNINTQTTSAEDKSQPNISESSLSETPEEVKDDVVMPVVPERNVLGPRVLGKINIEITPQRQRPQFQNRDNKQNLNEKNTPKSLNDFKNCDLVIEAVVENFSIKIDIFKEIQDIVSDDAIIASNTSSISITKMAGQLKNPANFIGIHFMNPVPIMSLVEIIKGLQTSEKTYNIAKKYSESLNKTTILALDSAGFIINRILCPMVNEAIFLLQEGVAKEDIDKGMKLGTNQPMGPLELADFVGLDTLLYIMQILHRELGEDKYRPCPLLIKYVEAGWLGRKAKRGFYEY